MRARVRASMPNIHAGHWVGLAFAGRDEYARACVHLCQKYISGIGYVWRVCARACVHLCQKIHIGHWVGLASMRACVRVHLCQNIHTGHWVGLAFACQPPQARSDAGHAPIVWRHVIQVAQALARAAPRAARARSAFRHRVPVLHPGFRTRMIKKILRPRTCVSITYKQDVCEVVFFSKYIASKKTPVYLCKYTWDKHASRLLAEAYHFKYSVSNKSYSASYSLPDISL